LVGSVVGSGGCEVGCTCVGSSVAVDKGRMRGFVGVRVSVTKRVIGRV
jgi:hypothetical protein